MDSLSDKIRAFLHDAGFEFNGDRWSNLELLKYFQQEYGLEMLVLMETEWIEEQIERDMTQGIFRGLREHVEDDRLADFDADVAKLKHPRAA